MKITRKIMKWSKANYITLKVYTFFEFFQKSKYFLGYTEKKCFIGAYSKCKIFLYLNQIGKG